MRDASLTLMCNPNSPSGTALTVPMLERLVDEVGGPFVLDEAYVDFADAHGLALARRRNVIVTRTLSKSYSLAGIRFGFAVADPALKLDGFFPLLLNAFGSWGGKVYGLPFDNYSGLLYYNACMLKEAGFDKPPATWDELAKVYAPKLTDKARNRYGYVLQSLRGETQSADSFMRMLWPFGGSLLLAIF